MGWKSIHRPFRAGLVGVPISFFHFCEGIADRGQGGSRLRGPAARVPRANAGHDSLRPRPQGHALSRLTRVAVSNRGLRAHAWSRRLGDDSISLRQKMKELIGMPTSGASSKFFHILRRVAPRGQGGLLASRARRPSCRQPTPATWCHPSPAGPCAIDAHPR